MVYNYNRGEVYLIQEDATIGTEIQKTRPWVVVSSDSSFKKSRVIALPLSTAALETRNTKIPVKLKQKLSYAVLDQLKAIDVQRVLRFEGCLQPEEMDLIDEGLRNLLDLKDSPQSIANSASFFYHQQPLTNPSLDLDYSQGPEVVILNADSPHYTSQSLALPNGQLLLVDNKSLNLWDVEQNLLCKKLVGHKRAISRILLLDEARVVTGSEDNTLRVWDIARGLCLFSLGKEHSEEDYINYATDEIASGITLLDKLPNGQLISFESKGVLRIWDINQKKCIKQMKLLEYLRALKVLPSGHVVCILTEGELALLDIKREKLEKISKKSSYRCATLAVLPSGYLILSTNELNNRFEIWDIANKKRLQSWPHNQFCLMKIIPLSNEYIIAGGISNLYIWNIKQEKCVQTIELRSNIEPGRIHFTMALLPNRKVITTGNDGALRIWQFPQKSLPQTQQPEASSSLFQKFCSIQ